VTDENEWRSAVGAVTEAHGRIDVLVNAAGIEGEINETRGSVETTSLAEWRNVMAVNLDGTFLGCRTVLPVMKEARKGAIINISSVASMRPQPLGTAYGASKAGVHHLTRSVAVYGARDGMKIRCNSVHPGMIRTRMLDSIFGQLGSSLNVAPEQAEGFVTTQVPFGHVGEPDDVAYLILFLASDEAKYITGSEFIVDGGWHLT
jgi:NAD(P)-dependent dehydrogenase (short-subunit alcohol dehydrogenase family)